MMARVTWNRATVFRSAAFLTLLKPTTYVYAEEGFDCESFRMQLRSTCQIGDDGFILLQRIDPLWSAPRGDFSIGYTLWMSCPESSSSVARGPSLCHGAALESFSRVDITLSEPHSSNRIGTTHSDVFGTAFAIPSCTCFNHVKSMSRAMNTSVHVSVAFDGEGGYLRMTVEVLEFGRTLQWNAPSCTIGTPTSLKEKMIGPRAWVVPDEPLQTWHVHVLMASG